jgi:predicted ester cyclase
MDILSEFTRMMSEGHGRGDEGVLDSVVSENFVLHCPDGSKKDRHGSRDAFRAMRNALSAFTIHCDPVLVDGRLLSARTIMEGRFTRPLDMGAMGRAEPNGQVIRFETISIFRFDENGRLVEEWAQSDNMTLMAQMGLPAREAKS